MSWRDAPGAPTLQIDESPLAGAPGLAVSGELDTATAPQLLAVLKDAIRDSQGAFVLDVVELTLLDSAGAGALLRARALLGREERDLLLVCPPSPVLHVLETAGVAELFAVFASRGAAARHLVPIR
jgi:anti-anti-sigma factor